jgi:RecB family endonuclease NucS
VRRCILNQVITEEFSEWEDSSRRIDLLCLDQKARLVAIEIKRTEDGGHMELQAIRYAAMVSSMVAFRTLEAQKDGIETHFGEPLG